MKFNSHTGYAYQDKICVAPKLFSLAMFTYMQVCVATN
jgi:hypothetical protein